MAHGSGRRSTGKLEHQVPHAVTLAVPQVDVHPQVVWVIADFSGLSSGHQHTTHLSAGDYSHPPKITLWSPACRIPCILFLKSVRLRPNYSMPGHQHRFVIVRALEQCMKGPAYSKYTANESSRGSIPVPLSGVYDPRTFRSDCISYGMD